MKLSLEEIASKSHTDRKTGIFQIPETIRNRRVIRYFLEYAEDQEEPPIVVLEEKYTRQSVMHKLGPGRCYNANRNLVIAILETRLLRTPSGKEPGDRDPIDNLSLAQVISFAYQIPIKQVLVSKSYLSSQKFKSLNPVERVRYLFNAYKGTSWFERFIRKYKRRRILQRFNPWHNISLRDLPEILCTSDYEPNSPEGNLTKLVNSGLIIPRERFKRFSPINFVDITALIELASLITGKTREQLTVKDTYLESIVESYINNKLLPYLERFSLKPDQKISLRTAGRLTGLDTEDLVKRLRIKLPKKRRRYYSKDIKIYALDLAAYELKNSSLQSFSSQDIADLFGMRQMDLGRCWLYANEHGTYARHQRVFPFYEQIVAIARKKLLEEENKEFSIPIKINGDTYYITHRTAKSYRRAYDLDSFTQKCIGHIETNLEEREVNEEDETVITCPAMILKLKGEEIISVQINTRGCKINQPD